MNQNNDNIVYKVFSNEESTETIFDKIKDWEITSQIKIAVSFDNIKRKELFEKIYKAATDESIRENIQLIIQRIEKAALQPSGYTLQETEYYQSLFANHFFAVLHSDNYQPYIEDKIRELDFYCKSLEQDLKTKQYEFSEDREQDKNHISDAERYKIYLENLLIYINTPAPEENKTKTDKLKAELGKYGFFELPKVKALKEEHKQQLAEWITTQGLPYSIAMLDYLGFLKHIENEHFSKKYQLHKEVSKWFNSDSDGRAVKGNISSLSSYSKENKSKYTAHTHKETVKKDYQSLK